MDAQTWLNTNGADIARGAWVDPAAGKVTFRVYAKSWRATKVDVGARTQINIDGRLDNYALPHFGDMQMSAIRPSDVRTFVAKLTGAKKAPSTVKAIYLTTAQVFSQAVVDGVIAKTPCAGVGLPRDRRSEEMHFLSPGQVNDLATELTDRYKALVYLASYGGLRAGELVALRVDSLDLGELGGTIAVTGAASEVRGRLVFGPTKTGRNRSVAIPRFLSVMLGDHIDRLLITGRLRLHGPRGWADSAPEFLPSTLPTGRGVREDDGNRRRPRGRGDPRGVAIPRSSPHLRGAPHRQRPTPRRGEGPPGTWIDPNNVGQIRAPVPRSP